MSEQERTARAVEARAAQKLTVNEAAELLRNEGRADTDIRERCRYWLIQIEAHEDRGLA